MPPYIGELRMFGGLFAPDGWAMCDGSAIAITQNQPLYNLIGTTYGGDGASTFNLPDLRGRVVTHAGAGLTLGQAAGEETVSLQSQQIPSHNHTLMGSPAAATTAAPQGQVLASTQAEAQTFPYGLRTPERALASSAITPVGNGRPHANLQPYTCITWIISLYGIYPSPT